MVVDLYVPSRPTTIASSRSAAEYEIPVIEDAAEALGATYGDKPAGGFGKARDLFRSNGNKIITTSGGGMLVSFDQALVDRARHLSTQARDEAPHYEHSAIGYNYRLSNLLAAFGRGQLQTLKARVQKRCQIFADYQEQLEGLPGLSFMPEAAYGRSTRWLTCIVIDPARFGRDRETVRLELERANIESRPLWKPMHLQPVFRHCPVRGGAVTAELFEKGLCLPSGNAMTEADVERVARIVRSGKE